MMPLGQNLYVGAGFPCPSSGDNESFGRGNLAPTTRNSRPPLVHVVHHNITILILIYVSLTIITTGCNEQHAREARRDTLPSQAASAKTEVAGLKTPAETLPPQKEIIAEPPPPPDAYYRTNIERALKEDATTPIGISTPAVVMMRMQDIDMAGCPDDFKAAYGKHIRAWEHLDAAHKEQVVMLARYGNPAAATFAFNTGTSGIVADELQEVQDRYEAAKQEVHKTFSDVEDIAVAYGAQLPGSH